MGSDTFHRHRLFAAAFDRADWTVRQAWLSYLALGGHGDFFDVEAFLEGLVTMGAHEQDVLAVALNERLQDLYRERLVPYLLAREPEPTFPTAVEALAGLLEQADHPGDHEQDRLRST
jgi:hypothetical protein